jgi:hypothetical protein
MSLQSWLRDREQWDIAKHQAPQRSRYTSDGRYVFDDQRVELAACRDERIAAGLAALLSAAGDRFSP